MKINKDNMVKISDVGIIFKNFYKNSNEILEKTSEFERHPNRLGEEIRITKNNHSELFEGINSFFIKAFEHYCKENGINSSNYILNNNQTLSINFWEPGASIGSHTDSYINQNDQLIVTDVSAIIYLTEDFEGADFVFEGSGTEKEKEEDTGPAGISVVPKKGDLLIFRSDAPHHVNKLISGTRVTVTQAFIKKGKYEV